MEYPSLQGKLLMPEYGRHVQQLVAHAMTLPTREERTACARQIVSVMRDLLSNMKELENFDKKLWDHLALLSDFKLDIDWPYGTPQPEQLMQKPQTMEMTRPRIVQMHYGRVVQDMAELLRQMPDDDRRYHLAIALANQMKRDFFMWNRDAVDDYIIFNDLTALTQGVITLQPQDVQLVDANTLRQEKQLMDKANQTSSKKKKKK